MQWAFFNNRPNNEKRIQHLRSQGKKEIVSFNKPRELAELQLSRHNDGVFARDKPRELITCNTM